MGKARAMKQHDDTGCGHAGLPAAADCELLQGSAFGCIRQKVLDFVSSSVYISSEFDIGGQLQDRFYELAPSKHSFVYHSLLE